jgi:hypothetical protein
LVRSVPCRRSFSQHARTDWGRWALGPGVANRLSPHRCRSSKPSPEAGAPSRPGWLRQTAPLSASRASFLGFHGWPSPLTPFREATRAGVEGPKEQWALSATMDESVEVHRRDGNRPRTVFRPSEPERLAPADPRPVDDAVLVTPVRVGP